MTLFNLLKSYNFTQLSLKEIRRSIEIEIPINSLQFKDESVEFK